MGLVGRDSRRMRGSEEGKEGIRGERRSEGQGRVSGGCLEGVWSG